MDPSAIWNVLRRKKKFVAPAKRKLVLQHLGLAGRDVGDMQAVLDRVGDELGLTLQLQGHTGDIVLLDVPFAARLSPQLVHAFTEGRPVVLIAGLNSDEEMRLSPARRFERRAETLRRQLRELDLVRRRRGSVDAPAESVSHAPTIPQGALASGFDSDFDSGFDGDQLAAQELEHDRLALLAQVLHGLAHPGDAPLTASYGPGANLLFDFRAGLVSIDPLAQQHLRVRRELPLPAAGARPQTEATVRELDETVWDLGLASGLSVLSGAPADWWHTPLTWVAGSRIERYTRIPRHLSLARRLADAPATPSQLRRHAQVGIPDLRRFLQACLVVGLVEWAGADAAGGTH